MSKVKKAGCIFINTKERTVALVLRKQTEYSFPKGHVEEGESLIDCAIRETAEETKEETGEDVIMYYFLAKDIGPSANTSEDTHPTFWIPFEEVYDKLSYPSLKTVWENAKDKVKDYFE